LYNAIYVVDSAAFFKSLHEWLRNGTFHSELDEYSLFSFFRRKSLNVIDWTTLRTKVSQMSISHISTDTVKSYDGCRSLKKLQLKFNVYCNFENFKITSVLGIFLFCWVSSDCIEVESVVRSVTHVGVDGAAIVSKFIACTLFDRTTWNFK
jgi:hypothetical protein